jgi:hypothetical protein
VRFGVVLFAALAACSSARASPGSAAFPADPYAVVASDGGALEIEVRTSPQPPERGVSSVELVLRDARGAPLDGVDVAVVPWMPAMGHGASVAPSVVGKGGGVYVVSNVDCYMPGRWELRATFGGEVNDRATIALEIP